MPVQCQIVKVVLRKAHQPGLTSCAVVKRFCLRGNDGKRAIDTRSVPETGTPQHCTMSQPVLFDSGPEILIDDAEGGVCYWPGFIDERTAADWFSTLRDTIHWQSERRPMYDRVVDVPRLLAGFTLRDETLPAVLRDAGMRVRKKLNVEFTHVGLNFYRDGRDSVAPHNDKLHSIVAGKPIALLSLGAARRMDIRDKQPPTSTRRIELQPGSLLVMSHDSQKHYDHGIPKSRQAVGPRISVVFRVRPQTL